VFLEREKGSCGKYDQAVVRAFECELGGDPLKCVGFGSRLSSSAWNLKSPPSALDI
jgi:hypothetical protein